MIKSIIICGVLACFPNLAVAGVGVHWYTEYSVYDHTATDLTGPDHPLLESHGAIWQLIYAGANDIADKPNPANGANGWVGGDDEVWTSRTIPQNGGTAPEDGTQWNVTLRNEGGNLVYEDLSWSTAGYMYQRIYEGSPAEQSWYYDGYLLAIDTQYTGIITERIPVDFNVGTPWAGVQPNQQIPVPEPATLGLLGLGALALAFRRRR